jgi:hypothetical protein
MKPKVINWFSSVVCCVLMIACGGGTKLTKTQIDPDRRDKPVSNLLVIGVTYNQETRRSFEGKMVAQLKATGIEAVTSVDVLPISEKQQLEKDRVLKVVDEFGNDAVLITHLVYTEEKEVITRDFSAVRSNYGFLWSYGNAYSPGYSSVNATIILITNLYDVKTQKLIWSGQSETTKPESLDQTIDDVIALVIKDLHDNQLLAK